MPDTNDTKAGSVGVGSLSRCACPYTAVATVHVLVPTLFALCCLLQAIKRLMTNLQRLRPTDPSRCVDFDVHGDMGRGIAGGGSNRVALLEAQAHGEMPAALPAAPHMMAADGSVKIPQKWDRILRHQAKGLGINDLGAEEEDEQQQRCGRQH